MFASVVDTPSSAYLQTVSGTSSCFFSLVGQEGLHRPTALRHSPALAGFVSNFASGDSGPRDRVRSNLRAKVYNFTPTVGTKCSTV